MLTPPFWLASATASCAPRPMIWATYGSALVGTLRATRIRFDPAPVPDAPPQAASSAVAARVAAARQRRARFISVTARAGYGILRTVTASPRREANRDREP